MSGEGPKEVKVEIDQLRPGVFIRLEGIPWYRHPFLMSSFRIKDEEQIETLRSLGLEYVVCILGRCSIPPIEKKKVRPKAKPSGNESSDINDEMFALKKKRMERLKEKRDRIQRTEHYYSTSIHEIENLMQSINRGNSQYIEEARRFSKELSGYFSKDSESILHVLNFYDSNVDNLYYHSLNTTVVSLILGKSCGLDEKDLHDLSFGALFHDLGKSGIDKRITRKQGKFTSAELKVLHRHPFLGVEILSKEPDFPKNSMQVVYQHHERWDGRGYPRKLKGEEINRLARIIAVANVYDGLINKSDPANSMTPYQALSYMFTKLDGQFEKEILTLFIHCMGIYPPGTIVRLNTGLIGMVISVNLGKPLAPSLVIYDPQVPKNEAIIIDMGEENDLEVEGSIHPRDLPLEVYDYLSPRTRITYFVDPTKLDKKD
jgi:HD-GYP domain-containing protein (c-di-GMP phosphodiesterase class II)